MALKKITNTNGFQHQVNAILAAKCRIYIAEGEFGDDDIPSDLEALAALYGSSGDFLPFGDMDNTGSNISWTEKTYEIDFSTVGLGYEVQGNFVSVTITDEMLDFCGDLGRKVYSFLFVPDQAKDIFFALSGVVVTSEGSLSVVEGDTPSKITFRATRKCNKITDAVKYKKLSIGTGS
ncbi:MAG: hypothetical protein WDA18_09305 [Candidatus Ratteibacteria bacterium]|nr:hypothetical protein [Candidatus Cloacimonadota bacterium]